MFLMLCELMVVVGMFAFFSTQVFMPIWMGTTLFPLFRREAVLRAKLALEKQLSLEAEIEKKISDEQKKRGVNNA